MAASAYTASGSGQFRSSTDSRARLQRLAKIARLADTAIGIPGTRFRFGFDSLVGALPVVGDFAMMGLSAFIIFEARQLGVPTSGLVRMAGNAVLDATLGSVPVLGDVFDMAFRANIRNLRIIEEHLDAAGGPVIDVKATRPSTR